MADIFFKFTPLHELPRPDKKHERAIRLLQHGVYFVYSDAAVFRRFFYRQCYFKVDRHVCFGLHTYRRYGSFAVKITCEVSFFVAHSGVSSCSADAPKDSGTICFECFEWEQCRFKKLFWVVSLFSFAFEAGHTKVNMWGNWILSSGCVSCFCLSVKSHRALFIKKTYY